MTDRLVLWWNFDNVYGRSDLGTQAFKDTDFTYLKSIGVDAIVAQTHAIRPDTAPNYQLAPAFAADPDTAARAKAKGIDMFLGYYAECPAWPSGPYVNGWKSPTYDARWGQAAEYMRLFAKWAKDHGCVGVAMDGEGQPINGIKPSWDITSFGGGNEAAATQRGAQIAAALAAGFPGLEFLSYFGDFPGSRDERVRRAGGQPTYSASNLLYKDFFLGFAQEPGIGYWEFWEANPFFYAIGDNTQTWDQAAAEHIQKFNAYWQTKLTAAQLAKVGTTLFAGPGKFDTKPAAASVDECDRMLQASKQGFRSVAMYMNGLDLNTIGQYAAPMQRASSVVVTPPDTTPPETTIDSVTVKGQATIAFSASEGATFEDRIDGGSWLPASSSPVIFINLDDGQHTVEVRATDAAGNVDQTPASVMFTTGGIPQAEYDAVVAERDQARALLDVKQQLLDAALQQLDAARIQLADVKAAWRMLDAFGEAA